MRYANSHLQSQYVATRTDWSAKLRTAKMVIYSHFWHTQIADKSKQPFFHWLCSDMTCTGQGLHTSRHHSCTPAVSHLALCFGNSTHVTSPTNRTENMTEENTMTSPGTQFPSTHYTPTTRTSTNALRALPDSDPTWDVPLPNIGTHDTPHPPSPPLNERLQTHHITSSPTACL